VGGDDGQLPSNGEPSFRMTLEGIYANNDTRALFLAGTATNANS